MDNRHGLFSKLSSLPNDINPLTVESNRDGVRFIGRLIDDYRSGRNQFSQPGKALFAASLSRTHQNNPRFTPSHKTELLKLN